MIKPAIPKGTRDFGSAELYKRRYIFNTIQSVFEKYGYEPIETPTMENLDTLTGKYGEEGDKLLFKVLNSGDYLAKANDEALADKDSNKLTGSIAEKGLRYDLTIPFARYVVQHQNDIAFPFKRYQIQPVWRADRPQKGRYREFYQCDVDVIGSTSLLNEVELIQIYDEVFRLLGLEVTIRVNNRKILQSIAQVSGAGEQLADFTVAIDKLDKIGFDGVNTEFENRGLPIKALDILKLAQTKGNQEKLVYLRDILKDSIAGLLGIQEMEVILSKVETTNTLEFDVTLARGLDYYTGTIFEVQANGVQMGSIGGGGRYDNLTEMFGLKDMSGVGVSFGAERIYDVMEELNLFPENLVQGVTAMFVNFGGAAELQALKYVQQLRAAGISAELYPDETKFAKQMKYADKKRVKFVIFLGEEELKADKLKAKDMHSGEEYLLDFSQIVKWLKS